MNYTAVGDTVNCAKRLEENAEAGQILMSKNSYMLVEGDVVARPLDPLAVKGRVAPIDVFELIDLQNARANDRLILS
jgi:adenylate cyclase